MAEKGSTGFFGRNGGNSLPSDRSQLSHIFNNRPGHLPDTPRNRQALLEVANDSRNRMGTDTYGNTWYARSEKDGSQLWATTRGGTIQNGGRNKPPREWDERSGLNNNPFKRKGR